ncbi:MAG: cytochrome c [Terriglobales bacterium]
MTVRGLLPLAGLLALSLLVACEQKPPTERLTNAEIAGEWLYDNNCAPCHENPQPDLHKQPPNLHGLFLRQSLPSGEPATDADVRKTIIEGHGTMPAFDQRLRQVDVNNLVKYLHTLR